MDFDKLVEKRYSVRGYTNKPVADEDLKAILNAARLAPTACNLQAFKIIVVHTAGRENEILKMYGREWFAQAPLVICVCGIPEENWTSSSGKNYVDVDVAIVMDHLILAATEKGLGTCWIAAFDPAAVKEVLKLPDGVEPIVLTPLGYPADTGRPKRRKSLDELVCYEYYH